VNHSTVNSITAGELHALGERTHDQRAGDAGERALEHEERQFRDVHALGEGRADRRWLRPAANTRSVPPMKALPSVNAKL
jgi:hypothetical protein